MKLSIAVLLSLVFSLSAAVASTADTTGFGSFGFVSGPDYNRPNEKQPNISLFFIGEFTEQFRDELRRMNYWNIGEEKAYQAAVAQNLPSCTIHDKGKVIEGNCKKLVSRNFENFAIKKEPGWEKEIIRQMEISARRAWYR